MKRLKRYGCASVQAGGCLVGGRGVGSWRLATLLPAPCLRRANRKLTGGRCRMHGSKSTGAPKGNNNAYVHGDHTAEPVALRKTATALRKALNAKIELALMMGL